MRREIGWALIGVLGVLVYVGCVTGARAAEETKQEPVRINKIYWCIHPYCWSLHGLRAPEGRDENLWNAQMARELWVHTLHMDLVSNMKPDEALVIYPIGMPAPQRQLIEHAERTLGRRCFVMTRRTAGENFFADVEDPIERFLNDDDWPGRDEWLHNMLTDFGKREEPEGVREEMEAEVREACELLSYPLPPSGLEAAYYMRMIAYDVEETFRERQLLYDPETVDCVAFGEGFEECCMTWKSMVSHYMGLAKPIENDYELSVSGAPCLAHARFKERIALSDDVRLFLWEGEGDEFIALFARAAARLSDPQLYARFSLAGRINLKVYTSHQKTLNWEGKAHTRVPIASLSVPVYVSTRRGGVDGSYYMIASGESFEQFRDRLAAAEIRTQEY